MDRVKAIRAPATTPGRIMGKVTYRKACQGVAYRSLAASSRSCRQPSSRAPTVMITKEIQKVMWAMIRVVFPRGTPVWENSTSRDRPMTISGIRMGRYSRLLISSLQRYW